ncbi:hypothetical protein K7X08_012997 [Anisodus acutangulus]|uniref:Uncharacterized protein n=1 Tax=Anisodus acutangulus TaxID=402998 RepID=A0A9Q1RH29_9SOLA|nr:hypothetical protein K7X08_012997 [Anisodus acutangulus]
MNKNRKGKGKNQEKIGDEEPANHQEEKEKENNVTISITANHQISNKEMCTEIPNNKKKVRKKKKKKKNVVISKSIQAMKNKLWNIKSTKAKKGGKENNLKHSNNEESTEQIGRKKYNTRNDNFKEMSGQHVVELGPLRMETIQLKEQTHNNDMEMASRVEETYDEPQEEAETDQDQGVISILWNLWTL